MNEVIAEIAKRVLRIATLEESKSDSLDFHQVAVWNVKAVLKEAYEAGLKAAKFHDGLEDSEPKASPPTKAPEKCGKNQI